MAEDWCLMLLSPRCLVPWCTMVQSSGAELWCSAPEYMVLWCRALLQCTRIHQSTPKRAPTYSDALCALINSGVLRCILVSSDVLWCILVYSGVFWCILVYSGVLWCTLVYYGVFWCILVYSGVFWCILVYFGVLWCILVYCGVFWCILVYSGVQKCYNILWCTEVHSSFRTLLHT